MVLPQTENTNMKAWQAAGWKITPLNVPVVSVMPPAECTDIRGSEPRDMMLIGTFKLQQPSVEIEPSEAELDTEDLREGLEAERDYLAKGKGAFTSYEEYRSRRLR